MTTKMKTKTISFLIASIFAIFLMTTLVSAAITITSIPTLSTSQGVHNSPITITSNEVETLSFTLTPSTITDSNGDSITFTLSSSSNDFGGANPTSRGLTISYTVPAAFDFEFGEDYSIDLLVSGTVSPSKTQKLSFETPSFCSSVGNSGDLRVTIEDISATGFAPEDNEWYPLDEVEIEVQIENSGDEDIENIEIEWVLLDSSGNQVMDGDESDVDVDEGDEETIIITFNVDPDELDSDEDYVFHVRGTGEIKDGVNKGDDTCSSDSEDIKIIMENDFVVLDDIQFTPETVQCNSPLQVRADVWNIGEDDQDDVYVIIENTQLRINEKVEIGDINALDSETLSATFNIPSNAQEGNYDFQLTVYDKDEDIYENSEDDESRFKHSITISGCNVIPENTVSVAASLVSSSVRAGSSVIVKAVITNTGSALTTYEVRASEYDSWGSLSSVEPNLVALGGSESKEVLLTFDINENVSGDQEFTIEVLADGKLIESSPFEITVQKSGFGGITGNVIGGDNWYLWGIGALNVILVIIIIIVAIRIARS